MSCHCPSKYCNHSATIALCLTRQWQTCGHACRPHRRWPCVSPSCCLSAVNTLVYWRRLTNGRVWILAALMQRNRPLNSALWLSATTCCFPKFVRFYVSTFCVTTCSAQRPFSVLQLIKTYFRSTVGNDHLNCFALLSIRKSTKLNCDVL